MIAFAASFLLPLLLCPSVHGQWTVGQEVETTSGVVVGHSSKASPEVSEYIGIPFGQSTEGAARFAPPKPYHGTERVNATKFGAACPQGTAALGAILGDLFPGNTSENCLFANVWTKPQTGEKKKAVLLWVFGGGFSFGDSATSAYSGAKMADNQDVVVVSFNYRVNIFGFPGAPGLKQQNPGLLDQRLAAEWTRDNVAAFGGDPDRITIFGESAGGSSVDYYAYAWKDDPIVAGLIAESGSAMGTTAAALHHPLNNYTTWYQVSTALGCGGEEAGPATVECVRNKPVKEVLDAASKASGGAGSGFTPWIDDQTVFRDAHARARRGQFIQKPMLIGTNQNESRLFSSFGGMNPAARENLDNEFRCGAADAAKARVLNKVPVWRYLFANNKDTSKPLQGATHGEEIPFVFGDGKTGLSGVFQPAWAAFAKDPTNGLTKLGWTKYDAEGKTLVRIAPNGSNSVDFVPANMYDGTCPPSDIQK